MRFLQLKRNSNVILRKKVYKSGKSWAIKSTLSLMGGLALLSFSQGNVIKADSTVTGTPVSQATAVADKQNSDDNTVADQENDGTENSENIVGDILYDSNATYIVTIDLYSNTPQYKRYKYSTKVIQF